MAIGGEVSVPFDTPNDIITAVALYNLTFYGFSPDERRSQLKKWFGKPDEVELSDLIKNKRSELSTEPNTVLSAGNQNRFKAPRKNLGALLFFPQSKRKGFIFSSRIFYRCSFLHFDNRESQKP